MKSSRSYHRRAFHLHHISNCNCLRRPLSTLDSYNDGSACDTAAVEGRPRLAAQQAFSILASRGKTWRRLRHIADLVCRNDDVSLDNPYVDEIASVADIGCDHGILAISLAASCQFKSVIGVDVSPRALEDGAISFHRKVIEALSKESGNEKERSLNDGAREPSKLISPLEFRVGSGLNPLVEGEADAVCIAGMGVNTMMSILFQKSDAEVSEMDRVNCKRLILQPTNSRPRNLIKLYNALQESGWAVLSERIESASSRWYITVSFERTPEGQKHSRDHNLPGELLAILSTKNPMHATYVEYVEHHQSWLENELEMKGYLNEQETHWYQIHTFSQ